MAEERFLITGASGCIGTWVVRALGVLPQTALIDGIAATIEIFKQAITNGRLSPNSM